MPKYDLPQNQIQNYLRYQELFLKTSRTTEEETEFQNLQTTLAPYLITANDFNNKADVGHTHAPADIGAAPASHTHTSSDITDFNTSLQVTRIRSYMDI